MNQQITITIRYRAKPGRAADLERELRHRVPISRTEAGTLDYRLYQSADDDHVYFLFSRYLSEKRWDVHLYEPYILSMLARMDELLAEPPRVEVYRPVMG